MERNNCHGRQGLIRAGRSTAGAFLLLCSIALLPSGCSHDAARSGAPPGTPLVRVLLLENQQQVLISATSPPVIRIGLQSAGQELRFPPGTFVPISLTPAGWHIGTASLGNGEMTLDPSLDGSLSVASHAYHGHFRFIPIAAGRFDVVNELDMENYIKGVLRSELFPNWHEEAYKAQAIVARTYALYESRTDGASRRFDVYNDQRSQVYGGISAETSRSRDATDATTGIVVAYGGPGHEVIFKSYFSSCCGGISQSSNDAFGDPNTPPLGDQNRGNCCSESPKFRWGTLSIKKAELTRRMRAWRVAKAQPLKDMGPVIGFEIAATNRFGRPVRFNVTDARGYRYSMRAEELREAVNNDAGPGVKVFSSFFKPLDQGDSILFTDGRGYGHGAGMCQWCAEHQATQGWNDESIVISAFPGAKLIRAY
jgi:stage II sporulation protein D